MTASIFWMVLAAAVLHAVWNALVKVQGDRLVFMALLAAAQTGAALCVVSFFPFPGVDAWPYLLASVALHSGYYLLLITAYRFGDLSHVYPIARGSAPLIISLLSVAFAGEVLSRQEILSVVLVTLGVMSLAMARGARGVKEPAAVAFALATGVFIAGYTVVDGLGARAAGDAHAYALWLFLLHGIPIAALTLLVRRRSLLRESRRVWGRALIAGLASMLAYWIVIWAMTLAPLALVSALRETSVVFAVIFGTVLLKERINLVRVAAVATTLIGAVMLKTSR